MSERINIHDHDHVYGICEELGLDATLVSRMEIESSSVRATILKTREGSKYIEEEERVFEVQT